jgi:hypothetical protein
MAPFPNEPYDPNRANASDDDFDRAARLDREAQLDPTLMEGRPSGGRIALFAIAIALVLGAVFYGLNNTSVHQASTAPPAQTAQTQPANPNSQPGVTTGAAPNRPAMPSPPPANPNTPPK